jgi:hypothetical protein
MWGTVTSLAKNINDSVHIILEPCSISRREEKYLTHCGTKVRPHPSLPTVTHWKIFLQNINDVVGIVAKMEFAL